MNKQCDVHRYEDPELTPKIFIDMLDNVIVVNGGGCIYRTDKCDGFYISKAGVFEENFCIDGSRDWHSLLWNRKVTIFCGGMLYD